MRPASAARLTLGTIPASALASLWTLLSDFIAASFHATVSLQSVIALLI
jgi:hypothetical protein